VRAAPEKPVVDYEQISAALDRLTDRRLGRVDRRNDVPDLLAALHLEAVERPRIVRMGRHLEVSCQILEHRF
jgi:hypothetical protein